MRRHSNNIIGSYGSTRNMDTWSRHYQEVYDLARLSAFIITACWCLTAQPPSLRLCSTLSSYLIWSFGEWHHARWCNLACFKTFLICSFRFGIILQSCCTASKCLHSWLYMLSCSYARTGPSFSSFCAFSYSWALRRWHLRCRGLYRATHSHSSATDGFWQHRRIPSRQAAFNVAWLHRDFIFAKQEEKATISLNDCSIKILGLGWTAHNNRFSLLLDFHYHLVLS